MRRTFALSGTASPTERMRPSRTKTSATGGASVSPPCRYTRAPWITNEFLLTSYFSCPLRPARGIDLHYQSVLAITAHRPPPGGAWCTVLAEMKTRHDPRIE